MDYLGQGQLPTKMVADESQQTLNTPAPTLPSEGGEGKWVSLAADTKILPAWSLARKTLRKSTTSCIIRAHAGWASSTQQLLFVGNPPTTGQ